MRKYRRIIARANMERAGIKQINKPRIYNGNIYPSFFTSNWRESKTPPEIERKAAKIRAENERRRSARNSARV